MQLNVTWSGHFVNKVHMDKNLLAKVAKANVAKGVKMLEDIRNNRSATGVPNNHGITAFRYAYEQGLGVTTRTSARVFTEAPNVEGRVIVTLQSALQEGHSVKVWVEATDFIGNNVTDATEAHFDSSPPTVSSVKFLGEAVNGLYPFSSECVHTYINKYSWGSCIH